MITYLGGLAIGAIVPMLATSLGDVKASLLSQLEDLAGDALALKGDLMALESDAAALAGELANVTGLADGLLQQLAAGPMAVVRGIEAAIASVLDGSSLMALQQAILGGPAAVLASLQAALADVQSRIASYQARIAGLASRIAALAGRLQALAARIAALKAMLERLAHLQALLATGGVHALVYAGRVDTFASELDGALGAVTGDGSDLAQAIVLVTTATSPWAALSKIFKVAA